MFLESSISTSNLPKSSKMYLRRYWRNRQPVLANSPTGIGQFANRYWPIRQPVLTKSSTGIGQFANRYWRIWQYIHINNAYSYCRHAEIANRYWPIRQPVLTNSPTGIDEIVNRYWSIIQRSDHYRLLSLPLRPLVSLSASLVKAFDFEQALSSSQ